MVNGAMGIFHQTPVVGVAIPVVISLQIISACIALKMYSILENIIISNVFTIYIWFWDRSLLGYQETTLHIIIVVVLILTKGVLSISIIGCS